MYFVLYLVTGTEMSSLSFKDLRGQAGELASFLAACDDSPLHSL